MKRRKVRLSHKSAGYQRLRQLVSKVSMRGDKETMSDFADYLDANVRGMESEAGELRDKAKGLR
jgi:hypothetical protein